MALLFSTWQTISHRTVHVYFVCLLVNVFYYEIETGVFLPSLCLSLFYPSGLILCIILSHPATCFSVCAIFLSFHCCVCVRHNASFLFSPACIILSLQHLVTFHVLCTLSRFLFISSRVTLTKYILLSFCLPRSHSHRSPWIKSLPANNKWLLVSSDYHRCHRLE